MTRAKPTIESAQLTRRDLLIASLLAIVFAGLGATRMTPGVCGVFHDDGVYVSTAKALAEGHGYSLINLPGSPPQTKYPILYPAVLALIWRIWPSFPDNLIAMQAVSLASGAISLGLSFAFLVRFRYCSRRLAFAAVAACATASFSIYLGTQTLSELPFALLFVIALWRIDSVLEGRYDTWTTQIGTGVLIALPVLCRSIGVVVIAGAIVTLLWSKRSSVWAIATAVALAGAQAVWTHVAAAATPTDLVTRYYTDYGGVWMQIASGGLLRIIRTNLELGFFGSAHLVMSGARDALVQVGLRPVLSLLVLGAVPWVIVVRRAFRLEPLAVVLFFYALLVAVWPWPPDRFLVPVLPFVVAYLGLGLRALVARVPARLVVPLAVAAVGLIVVSNVILSFRLSALIDRTGYPYALPTAESSAPRWSSYEALFAWVREHTAPDDRLASGLDTMMFLYTGRQGFRAFPHRPDALFYGAAAPKAGTAEELLKTLRAGGARYVVLVPMPFFAEEAPFAAVADDLRQTHASRVRVAYLGLDPRFVVLEVEPGPIGG